MNKSAAYVDVVYVNYFINIERIHEFNLWGSCLVYLYSKIGEIGH